MGEDLPAPQKNFWRVLKGISGWAKTPEVPSGCLQEVWGGHTRPPRRYFQPHSGGYVRSSSVVQHPQGVQPVGAEPLDKEGPLPALGRLSSILP